MVQYLDEKNIMEKFTIGRYTIIDENVVLKENVWIGNFVHIRPDVIINKDSEVRDHCFVAPQVIIGTNSRVYQYCIIGMGSRIGNNCFIGARTILTNDKEISYPRQGSFFPQPVIIKDDVRVGAGCVILPGVVLNNGCRIGAGSVVTKDVPVGETWFGNPARFYKSNKDKED